MGDNILTILLIILGIGAVIGVALYIYSYFEAGWLKVDIRDITPPLRNGSRQNKTITIGFLSDSHGKYCHFTPERVIEEFNKYPCDMVLFGGDCCLKDRVEDTDFAMLTKLSAALKEKNIPLYAVYGNHDRALRDEDFGKMGTILLRDRWEEITIDDVKFALGGLYDSGRKTRTWPAIPEGFSDYPGFRLMLVHNPDYIYSLDDCSKTGETPYDYQLSGHLHGGQVHLPFCLEYRLLRSDRIALEDDILSGEFTLHGISGFISKGVGCGALPIRFCARPEIHILKFHI